MLIDIIECMYITVLYRYFFHADLPVIIQILLNFVYFVYDNRPMSNFLDKEVIYQCPNVNVFVLLNQLAEGKGLRDMIKSYDEQ